MAEKMYFGVLENIQEIPVPKSGMGVDSNSDTEVTDLVSGGRSIYRAPTTYKTFNMTWAKTADQLRHLISMYSGQFGTGPFYMTDPTVSQKNVLPARWSNGWQLAHVAGGWCRPKVVPVAPPTGAPSYVRYFSNRASYFTQATAGSAVKLEGIVRTRLIRVPGKAYYFMWDGTTTGGAGIKVRGYNGTTGVWTTLTTSTTPFTPATLVAAGNTTTTMLEVDLYMPLGSTLLLNGISLGTVDTTTFAGSWMPVGSGIGPVNFGDSTNGELVSSVIDRIGLSLDFTEVESVEG